MQLLTRAQIIKGSILVFLYIIVKTCISQIYALYQGFDDAISVETAVLFGGMFIVCFVLLTMVGLRYWLGVPLGAWITTKNKAAIDIVLGLVLGFVVLGINMLCFALFISFQLIPPSSNPEELAVSVLSYVLTFGFRVIIAPCEELLFRGFTQQALTQSFGAVFGIVFQAVLYAVMYIGYYPLELWFFIVLPFLHGLLWGFIRHKRRTCLSSIIGHGIAG